MKTKIKECEVWLAPHGKCRLPYEEMGGCCFDDCPWRAEFEWMIWPIKGCQGVGIVVCELHNHALWQYGISSKKEPALKRGIYGGQILATLDYHNPDDRKTAADFYRMERMEKRCRFCRKTPHEPCLNDESDTNGYWICPRKIDRPYK